jgi:hypothetical protein
VVRLSRLSLSFLLVLVLGIAPLLAVSYVVPADRFEIERSSAIIAGRVLGSHVEKSPRFGIETVTDIVVEEAIKGGAGSAIRVHEPGGVMGDDVRVIPGIPVFTKGDRVLLFLYQRDDGEFCVNDLQLGSFHFVKDIVGRDLVIRDESEVNGWDVDGSVHREGHRSAEAFINYIRAVVRGELVAEDYFIPTEETVKADALRPISKGAFTASSYTVDLSGGLGSRWNVFPSTVTWNRGNSEVGVLGNGASQINTAFSSWNAGGAHYVLASANANSNGIAEAADGVNNAVFEKNLAAFGAQPYSCMSGGVLGAGGINVAHFGADNHVFHGETFGTTVEVDLSMNQGLGLCSLAQFPTEAFNTTVTHEVGHTLGFRHSDQNRTQNALCSTDPTLECSNSAIMDHLIIHGFNGQLQPWDSNAINAVYGAVAACTPPSISQQPVSSAIASGSAASLSVIASGTLPLTYQWFVGSSGNTSMPLIGSTTPTISISPAITTTYWVRVTGQCAPVADSNAAIITVSAASCPVVVLGAPQASPVNGGFQLSIVASGGVSFTYQWFQGASSGVGSPIGSGNPRFVNPPQTTSYWCRVTNDCNNTSDSSVVTVTVVPCSPPQIIVQPKDQTTFVGASVSLTVGFIGTNPSVTWFQGAKGDTSNQVGSGQTITSPVLMQTTQFWARIANVCGSVDSDAATITAKVARRRAVSR